MRINKLRLHNFRNFEDETFDFPSQFTIVIGNNGKGKSSLLQGLRLAAASFFLGLDESERLHIQKEDIRRIDTGKRFALQPNWQRGVVNDLKRAFPNLQFIATTHSPFIIQSVMAQELINLDKETDVHPKDLSIEDVAQDIMGVESAFAFENAQHEKTATDYLSTLDKSAISGKGIPLSEFATQLDDMEAKVSDPAVRVFLQMKRLEKAISK